MNCQQRRVPIQRTSRSLFPVPVSTRSSESRGFTVLELLVVIGVISVLLSLLLPAVQQVREASRQTNCRSQLRQIALALHLYADLHRSLPPGYVHQPLVSGSNGSGFGWAAFILPMLDQGPLSQRIDFQKSLFDPANQFVREQHLPIYQCPSDSFSDQEYLVWEPTGTRFATGSYAANFGIPDLSQDFAAPRGPFGENSSVRFSQFTDGLSQTILCGERRNGPFSDGNPRLGHDTYETLWLGVLVAPAITVERNSHTVLFQAGHPPNDPWSDHRDAFSAHDGIVFYAFGDGTVRGLSPSLDLGTYQALCTLSEGEVVAFP